MLAASSRFALEFWHEHYNDAITSAMVSQITRFTIVYSTVYSGADQRKHQSSASQASVRGIHRWLVNSPPKRRRMFPFDDVIMDQPCNTLTMDLRLLSFAEAYAVVNDKHIVFLQVWSRVYWRMSVNYLNCSLYSYNFIKQPSSCDVYWSK